VRRSRFKHKTEWMGHRPAPTDSIPVIGEWPVIRGAFLGFSHHRVILTSGPKNVRVLAQLASGWIPTFDASPYAPSRFRSG